MIMIHSDTVLGGFRETGRCRACPECGASMNEVDRRNEKDTMFVWYDCSRSDCDGQWLAK